MEGEREGGRKGGTVGLVHDIGGFEEELVEVLHVH